MNKVNPVMLEALARATKEADRGRRDATKAITKQQVKAAMRTASPAGLGALFPGLKKGKP